jgi:hypothetical protein
MGATGPGAMGNTKGTMAAAMDVGPVAATGDPGGGDTGIIAGGEAVVWWLGDWDSEDSDTWQSHPDSKEMPS